MYKSLRNVSFWKKIVETELNKVNIWFFPIFVMISQCMFSHKIPSTPILLHRTLIIHHPTTEESNLMISSPILPTISHYLPLFHLIVIILRVIQQNQLHHQDTQLKPVTTTTTIPSNCSCCLLTRC